MNITPNPDDEFDLYAIRHTDPYRHHHQAPEDWLELNEKGYKIDRYNAPKGLDEAFEEVFIPFKLFRYYPVDSLFGPRRQPNKGPRFPYASFLSEWMPPHKKDYYIFENEYERAKVHYLEGASGAVVPRDKLHELAAERDLLEKQVRYAGEQLAVLVNSDGSWHGGSLETVLKAWLAEALRMAEKVDDPKAFYYDTQRFQVTSLARRIWIAIIWGSSLYRPYGFKQENETWIEEALQHKSVDPRFTKAQARGLKYYMGPREVILDYAYRINQRRIAIEWVLYYALMRKPLRTANEITHNLSDERAKWLTDGRATGKHLELEMVRCFWAFHDTIEGQRLSNKQIRKRVLDSFGNPVGDRQFLKYLTGNPKPQLETGEVDRYLERLSAPGLQTEPETE